MVKKETQRKSDRRKLVRYTKMIEEHFQSTFQSLPYCNRCKNVFSPIALEINHLNYDEIWRFAELVCRDCHDKIDDSLELPKFEEIKKSLPQTIIAFQKEISGLMIVSRLTSEKLIIRASLKLRKFETVNPKLPLSFI